MKKLLVLTDYRGQFWLTTRHKEANFNLTALKAHLEGFGFEVEFKTFPQIDFKRDDYRNWWVLYQSTEDPRLAYNDYIEDILLGLKMQGARLLPDFEFFRAHHNKVFMEILRDVRGFREMQTIHSHYFGTYEEYQKYLTTPEAEFPHVVKLGEGAQSKNVKLVRSPEDAGVVKSMMFLWEPVCWIKEKIKPFLKKRYPDFRTKSFHRRKIVVQNFIPGLSGDYKVLLFGERVYVLRRDVRNNDFRASGSGKFAFPENPDVRLLEFAGKVFEHFRVPFLSLDIAFERDTCHLIEFQFVTFGTYTLEKSPWYFTCRDGKWEKVTGPSDLEQVFAKSVAGYISKNED